jgi:DNA polymerase-3 subunit gamma/tau
LQETAEELSPGSPLPAETRLEKALSRALSAAEKVCSALVTDNIPVNMIRRATFWAHMTTQGNRKIILVENADAMQASSRNALLKILEEPPAGVYFLLITTRRGAIMPTILSRTRSYSLRDRSLDDTQRVLERIFRLPGEGCATMRDFFLRMEFSGTADIRLLVHGFIQAVQASAPDISVVTTVGTTLKAAPTRTAFRYFLEELTRQGSAELRNIEGDTRHRDMRRLEKWNRIMHEHMTRVDQFNMNAEMALETLYYELRRVD